jgi:hypothetical protein
MNEYNSSHNSRFGGSLPNSLPSISNLGPAWSTESCKGFLMRLKSQAMLPSLDSPAWLIHKFAVKVTAAVESVLKVTHCDWLL